MAVTRFLLVVIALAAVSSAAKDNIKRVRSTGKSSQCVSGKTHTLKYDVTAPAEEVILDLDSIDHLKNVQCDIDHTRLILKFSNEIWAADYFVRFHDFNDHFLVGGGRWNCSVVDETKNGLIIRRVVGADLAGDEILVKAAEAQYDEIYEQADISFSTASGCDEYSKEIDQDICVGWNTDCKTGATNSIPLFTNQFIKLACSSCFVDFNVDVFIDVKIQDFQLVNLSAGFRNMYANGSIVLNAQAAANWNTGVDKTVDIEPTDYLVNFKVGPVPFMIYFEIPVELKTSVMFQTNAMAQFGSQMNLNLGDAYVSWNPASHWTHTKPHPSVQMVPQIQTAAALDAQASISIIPSLNAHFDKILSYNIAATPEVDASITGSEASKKICFNSSYTLNVQSQAQLSINIPWANIHDDKTWNKDIFNSGKVPLGNKCLPL